MSLKNQCAAGRSRRSTDPFSKGNTFGGDVHHELLEAIDDFDAKEDAAVFGAFDRFAHALESSRIFGLNSRLLAPKPPSSSTAGKVVDKSRGGDRAGQEQWGVD
jgi:hypothetical protein